MTSCAYRSTGQNSNAQHCHVSAFLLKCMTGCKSPASEESEAMHHMQRCTDFAYDSMLCSTYAGLEHMPASEHSRQSGNDTTEDSYEIREEEEEWAGARELVDSSYQPTYVVLEGHNPIPSALSCTFLPANRQATSIFKGNGRTT